MPWLTAFNALLSLLKALADEVQRRQAQQALDAAADTGRRLGTAETLTEVFHEAANLIAQADHARRVFRDQLRAHPERLSDDDGYKRSDG